MKSKFFTLSIFFLIIGCELSDYSHAIPIVKTLEVSNITESGATLNGSILSLGSDQKILEYGFIWSLTQDNRDLSNKIVAISAPVEGNVSIDASLNLNIGKEYFVRIYVKTDQATIYGNEVSFSVTLNAAAITDVEPSEVFDGEEIFIRGRNFPIRKEDIKVFIGNVSAEILESKENALKVRVPGTDLIGIVPIRIEILDQVITADNDLRILGPIITSVSPANSNVGNIIEITGDDLLFPTGLTVVWFGVPGFPEIDQYGRIVELTKNKIKVAVPNHYRFVPTTNSLEALLGVVVFSEAGGIKRSQALKFTYDNLWSRIGSFPLGLSQDVLSVSLNGKGYCIGFNGNYPYEMRFWEFDPIAKSWQRLNDFPGGDRRLATMVGLGNKIYFGMGTSPDYSIQYKDIWVFDTDLNVWSYLTDFPGDFRINALAFGLNDKINFGFGTNRFDLWTYNLFTQEWTEEEGVKNQFDGGAVSSFIENGELYLLNVKNTSPQQKMLKLEPNLSIWISKPELTFPDFVPIGILPRTHFSETHCLATLSLDRTSMILKFSSEGVLSWNQLQDGVTGMGLFVIGNQLYLKDSNSNLWTLPLD